MRWRVVVPLAIAVAVAGGAAVVVVENVKTPSTPSSPRAVTTPVRPPVLASLRATAPRPTRPAVAAVVAAGRKTFPAGEQVSGMVVDAATGKLLWSLNAGTPQPPASTLKLLTAAAALRILGPTFHFTTTVRKAGGTLYLVGGGDTTLVESSASSDRPVVYPEPASLADLAARTAAALPKRATVQLRIDTSAWPATELPSGWASNYVTEGDVTPPSALEVDGGRLRPSDWDSPRTADPAGQTAAAFVALLHKDGVTVHGQVTSAKAPPHARQVAAVPSPPLAALVQRLLTESDNDLAEALGRAIAIKKRRPATFVGEAAALRSALSGLGVRPAQLSLQDSSGLSHSDAVAPTALLSVLLAAARGSDGDLRPIIEGLPVAGFTGTLSDRYRDKDRSSGAGVVRAKTGSLVGVNALAGFVVDRSGRLLAFALMGSGTTETDEVQDGLDSIASGLAQLT